MLIRTLLSPVLHPCRLVCVCTCVYTCVCVCVCVCVRVRVVFVGIQYRVGQYIDIVIVTKINIKKDFSVS